MVNSKQFFKYLQEPETLNDSSVVELEQLIKQFPFFQTAHLVYLLSLKKINKKLVQEKLPLESLYVADRRVLFNLLADKPEPAKPELKKEVKAEKPEEKKEDKTAKAAPRIIVTKTTVTTTETKTEPVKTEKKEEKPTETKQVETKTAEIKTAETKTAEKSAVKKKLTQEERKTNHENLVKDFFGVREENNYQTVATNIAEDGSIKAAASDFAKEENVSQAVVLGEKKSSDTILDQIANLRKEKEEVKKTLIAEEQAAQKAKEEKEKEEKLKAEKEKAEKEEKLKAEKEKAEKEKTEKEKAEQEKTEKAVTVTTTTTVVTETVTTTTEEKPVENPVEEQPAEETLSAAEKLMARLNKFKKEGSETPEQKPEKQPDLIDKFLEESPHIDRNKEVSTGDMGQDSVKEPELYSEKLAKLYITQKLYDKAIASYENLITKYPEKRGYFEDRIKEINNLKNNQ